MAALPMIGAVGVCAVNAAVTLTIIHRVLLVAFLMTVAWRGVATGNARPPPRVEKLQGTALPYRTGIVSLYQEAAMVCDVVGALAGLGHPKRRLQILFALGTGDHDTLASVQRVWTVGAFDILISPPGLPVCRRRCGSPRHAASCPNSSVWTMPQNSSASFQRAWLGAPLHVGGASTMSAPPT